LWIERFERERSPIPAADSVALVRFLIDQQGLRQRDLMPQFGSESAGSMFLRGQRQLTVAQLERLSDRFQFPADLFLAREKKSAP
jgi:HTH-type transcriptional regulator/antitoxin HigA